MISIIIEGVTNQNMHASVGLSHHIFNCVSHLTNCHCACVGDSNSKVGHDSITSFVWMPMVFNQSESPSCPRPWEPNQNIYEGFDCKRDLLKQSAASGSGASCFCLLLQEAKNNYLQ